MLRPLKFGIFCKREDFSLKPKLSKLVERKELPMSTIPQNEELLKHLFELIQKHRVIFKQERVYQRIFALVLAELFVFARHTITQMMMTLGMVDQDWSAMYRLFSQRRFKYEQAREVLFRETLEHIGRDEILVLAGDGTQTPRSSRKLEGSGWLRNMRTPAFMVGIHAAQRWFNGSILLPAEEGYSRALPVYWEPAFTEKSTPKEHDPRKEWEAALEFLVWTREQLVATGRAEQQVLMVADGSYDTLKMWQKLPDDVTVIARTAKNRALWHLPDAEAHGNRKYGDRAPSPQEVWQERKGWTNTTIEVRHKTRHLQYKVSAPVLRKQAPGRVLFLITVRGKRRKKYRRNPMGFLVNAILNDEGEWVLPFPIEVLLFWLWQRWEIEVCHRELKSNFGLGQKQCFNPHSAVLSVQWSAWVYCLLLLAGYRTWGLSRPHDVPTRWWRGSARWSINTLLRSFRAALWGQHHFQPLCTATPRDWAEKETTLHALFNSVFATARS